MDLTELVQALRRYDALFAREWVQDARRAGLVLSGLPFPHGLDSVGTAIAASVVELLARQWGQRPPEWTQKVGPSPEPLFLVQAANKMARLKKLCELEGPEPFRKRLLYAPPDFLTTA